MVRNFSITIGILLFIFTFFTVFPNTLVGTHGYFETDFLQNLIHFLTAVLLIILALQYEKWLSKSLRWLGGFYLFLAVLGAVTTGFDNYQKIGGVMLANGPDHLLHLILGVIFVVLGTKMIRMPYETREEIMNDVHHVDIHS